MEINKMLNLKLLITKMKAVFLFFGRNVFCSVLYVGWSKILFRFLILVVLSFFNFTQSFAEKPIFVIRINGTINPATDDYLKTSLAKAKKEEAKLFVIILDTPGGLLISTQTMVKTLLGSSVPTVVYVSPSGSAAISAGVFIALAADFAAMAHGTTIGAAHPVMLGGESMDKDAKVKIENVTVSLLKSIAEQRGRNPEWAEKAVRESLVLSEVEALGNHSIDLVATDIPQMLDKLEGRIVEVQGELHNLKNLKNAPLKFIEMSFKQRWLNVLSDPNILILLGLGALFGIAIEFYHPGAMFPGICGLICLFLALTSAQILPISYGGLALIILGAIFFIVELVIPSFGLWGIAGIVSLILGSVYLVDTDMIWSDGGFEVNKMLLITVAACVAAVIGLIASLILSSSKRKVFTGKEGIIGKKAECKEDFVFDEASNSAKGRVLIMGEIWKASLSGGDYIPKRGEVLEVTDVDALTLICCKLTPKTETLGTASAEIASVEIKGENS